jgi:hypothetical protein
MIMDAIEFVNKYPKFLEDISEVVKDEYQSIVDDMCEVDPHDLIPPEAYFVSETHALGFVWNTFNILRKSVTSNSK